MIKSFLPILDWLPQYKKSQLQGDLYAGLTVGVLLIPQGMAYALIAGLPPVYGLYASLVPQLIYAIFGTSRQLSVGPVAMDSLLVATGVSVLAVEGTEAYLTYAILLALFMGLAQLLLGILRMGFITHLLSRPVISGFTSAAALIIGVNQLKYVLNVPINKGAQMSQLLTQIVDQISETHVLSVLLALGAFLVMKSVKKINKKIPGALLVVVLGILLVKSLDLEASGVSIVKEIPAGLPAFIVPDFSWEMLQKLLPLAMTIAVVAFMEAYSVAKALEAKCRDHKVRPNQEMMALGLANVVGSFFQGYPVTGGFSRSAVNHDAGAKTPLAMFISAALVALTLLFLTPVFYHLPYAVLAAIIMSAVVSLIDFKYARELWRTYKVEFALWLATLVTTLQWGMVEGIVSGIVLSILILLFRAANPHMAVLGRVKGMTEFRNVKRFQAVETWRHLLIVRIDAPFAFVNIQTIKEKILTEVNQREGELTHVICNAASVAYMDATGVLGLRDLMQSLAEKNIQLLFAEVIGPVRDAMARNHLINLGKEQVFFLTTEDAVNFCTSENFENKNAELAVQHNLDKSNDL